MKRLLAVPALLLSTSVLACPSMLPADKPVLPNGNTASAVEMHDAGVAVRDYISNTQTFLSCGVVHELNHNRYVSRLESLARDYNSALRVFKERDSVVDAG